MSSTASPVRRFMMMMDMMITKTMKSNAVYSANVSFSQSIKSKKI